MICFQIVKVLLSSREVLAGLCPVRFGSPGFGSRKRNFFNMGIEENFNGFYISENLLLFPGQLAITKLSFPRLFLRFEYDEKGYFADYDEWKESLITIDWLDPKDKPTDEGEIDEVLTDCWNFLASHEQEEERLYEENGGYQDDELY